jgi:hypothetical protein
MKAKTRKNRPAGAAAKLSSETRELLAAARRMGRMVRAENRRWALPLIVMRDGKIRNEPA